MFRLEDNVTCRARYRSLASTFEIDIVFVRNSEDVIPLVGFDGFYEFAFGILEMDFDPGEG